MYHSDMKHIDVKYHWLRSTIEDQLLQRKKIRKGENVANMWMMVVSKEKLELCVKFVGMNKN
mgnify:CR=1 FL=1